MTAKEIGVGIKTDGYPLLTKDGDSVILHNMLIGDGFHWQRKLEARLPGKIRLLNEESHSEENITLINILPIETYLQCVVGSEMNPESPVEFLKAHAVISRSWAIGKVLNIHESDKTGEIKTADKIIGWEDTSSHHGFDVCSDDHCQRYQGLQPLNTVAREALRGTEGEVLVSQDGKIVDARFSKCCGGRTEIFSTCWGNKNYPYLKSFADPWCDLSTLSSDVRNRLLIITLKDYDRFQTGYGYNWQQVVTKSQIEKNLKEKFGIKIGRILGIQELHRGPSGRIDLLRVKGDNGVIDIGKELWIRKLLSDSHLYSSAFDIEDTGDEIILNGHGWGHGVGLCQIGAARMAWEGKNYKEILEFYYPGTALSRL